MVGFSRETPQQKKQEVKMMKMFRVVSVMLVNAIPEDKEWLVEKHFTRDGVTSYQVEVALRGNYYDEKTGTYDRQYAVMVRGDVYGRDLEPSYEPIPSERTDDFKDQYRFNYEEALSIAARLSQSLTPWVMRGRTASETIAQAELLESEG